MRKFRDQKSKLNTENTRFNSQEKANTQRETVEPRAALFGVLKTAY
jgi:hypothetical protein